MDVTRRKILITGASGFIGSHLARRVVQNNFEVALIRREKSNTWRISDLLDTTTVYIMDIRDSDNVLNIFSDFQPDVVFHLATFYAIEHTTKQINEMLDTNVKGTINLLEASKQFKSCLFVNTSSCFVYKESPKPLTEQSPLSPLNLYALTKTQAEQACSFYSKKYGQESVTFRLFPPYGPFDHERRLIPYLIQSILNNREAKMTSGKQKWDYTYINDIINAYLSLLYKNQSTFNHEVFNIGAAKPVSVREISQYLNKLMNSPIVPRWGAVAGRKNDVQYMCADISKAKRLLGWSPKTEIFNKGLDLTAKWFGDFWKKGEKHEI